MRKRKHRDEDDLGHDDEEYAAGGGFHDPGLQPSATAALQAARAKAARDQAVKKPQGGGKRPEVEPRQQIVEDAMAAKAAAKEAAAKAKKAAAREAEKEAPPKTEYEAKRDAQVEKNNKMLKALLKDTTQLAAPSNKRNQEKEVGEKNMQEPAALPVGSPFPPPTQPVRASAGRKGGDSRRA